ncbi:MAG: hypothetical protein R2941_02605 [Desulfobacterales bacterium]
MNADRLLSWLRLWQNGAIVKKLLEKGADISATDKMGKHCSDDGLRTGSEEAVKILLEKGALCECASAISRRYVFDRGFDKQSDQSASDAAEHGADFKTTGQLA